MVDNLEVFRASVAAKLNRLKSAVEDMPPGRGAHLATLTKHTLSRFDDEIAGIEKEVAQAEDVADPADKERLLANSARKFERLGHQLNIIHFVVAKYRNSIDRSDVPVGIQHLVGTLMTDVLISPGDPMINLDPDDNYSTVDLVDLLDRVLDRGIAIRAGYSDPHPIAFNVPALDPSNALLAPLLAHEVAHTAVNQKLLKELQQRDAGKVDELLVDHLARQGLDSTSPAAIAWAQRFFSWCSELLCDAVGLALCGPSFAWAFAGYLPPSKVAVVNTHPPLRDRMAFHLHALDQLGWTSMMTAKAPVIVGWLQSAAASPALTHTAEETFLREAVALLRDDILAVALAHIKAPLTPSGLDPLVDEAEAGLRAGIPWVEIGSSVLTTWQVVLVGWFAAIAEASDIDTTLVTASHDAKYNALLVKALEMSSIVQAWRGNGNSAA